MLLQGRRSNAVYNIAGDMQTVDVVPKAAGDFKVQCRTSEHVAAGMIAKFHVEDNGTLLLLSSLQPSKLCCSL